MKTVPCVLLLSCIYVLAPASAEALRPIGTHTPWVAASTCPTASPSIVPTTECVSTIISCTSSTGAPMEDLPLQVKYSAATASPHRGRVVLSTGGDGRGFYEATYTEQTRSQLLLPLLGNGYDVIQISWGSVTVPKGWLVGPAPDGFLDLACRWGTAVAALNQRYQGDALCAVGQSGAGGGLGYCLGHYGCDAALDQAVICSQPFTRVDWGCIGRVNDAEWNTQCLALKHQSICGGSNPWAAQCEYQGNQEPIINGAYANYNACTGSSPNLPQSERDKLRGDSILSPGFSGSYPHTRVDMVMGGGECGIEIPQTRLLKNAVTSEVVETVLFNGSTGLQHGEIPTIGAPQLLALLSAQCIPRHSPPSPADAGFADATSDAGPPDLGAPDSGASCNCCQFCP